MVFNFSGVDDREGYKSGTYYNKSTGGNDRYSRGKKVSSSGGGNSSSSYGGSRGSNPSIERINRLMFNSSGSSRSSGSSSSSNSRNYSTTSTSATPTWQQKLNNYKTDKNAAQQELLRAKAVYMSEQRNGASSDRLKQIRHWADQVRSAAGISATDSTYGNPTNGSLSSGDNSTGMTWQEKLGYYEKNPHAAMDEVLRAKEVFEEEKAKGVSAERLNQIMHWANQVRAAGGLNDSEYGSGVTVDTVRDRIAGRYADPSSVSFLENNNSSGSPYQNTSQTNTSGLNQVGDVQRLQSQNQNYDFGNIDFSGLDQVGNVQRIQSNQPQNQNVDTSNVNFDQYRTQSATINDIAKKYGFDFTRDDAKTQAEAEAQAKRNAIQDAERRNTSNRDQNLQSIENNVRGASNSLDRNYFQQYMNQAQGQVNSGLNGGIAADQNLRLAMNRQAEMGDVYRDASLGRMQENNRFTNEDIRLAESMGLVNQEALARENSLYNDQLKYLAGLAQNQDQLSQSENLAMLQAALSQRGQNIGMDQFNRNMSEQVRQFDQGQLNWENTNQWSQAMDRLNTMFQDRQQNMQNSQFNRNMAEQVRQFDQGQLNWENTNDWSQAMDRLNTEFRDRQQNFNENSFWSQLSGYLPNGKATLDRTNSEFSNQLAQEQFNNEWTKLSPYQKEQIAMAEAQLASTEGRAKEDATLRWYELMLGLAESGVDASQLGGMGASSSSSPFAGNFTLDNFMPSYLKK